MTRALNVLLVALVAIAAVVTMLLGDPHRPTVDPIAAGGSLPPPAPSLVAGPSLSDSRALTVRVGTETIKDGADRRTSRTERQIAEAPVRDRPAETVPMPLPFGQQRTVAPFAPTSENDARHRLTRSIQTELHRVGCYSGAIDGDWGQASQRAMRDFNERINATLPIHQPDYILLTLLQGHAKLACGAPCPLGQIAMGEGVCQPQSVVAEERRRSNQTEPGERETQAGKEAVAGWAQTMARTAAPVAGLERTASATASRQALLDAERARIAAVQQRKRQQASEAEARLEGQRLAQQAEAERARTVAEARRREELAALEDRRKAQAANRQANGDAKQRREAPAERIARVLDPSRPPPGDPASPIEARSPAPPSPVASIRTQTPNRVAASATTVSPVAAAVGVTRPSASSASGTLSSATTGPGSIVAGSSATGVIGAASIGAVAAATSPGAALAALPQKAPSKLAESAPRYVGRFIPPPTYRVGRLSPTYRLGRLPPRVKPSYLPPVVRTYVVKRRPSPQRIFGHVQHHAP